MLLLELRPPRIYVPLMPSYIIAYVVQHPFNSVYETLDVASMRVALLSYNMSTREHIQKTPSLKI
jgi:hypothetical protein